MRSDCQRLGVGGSAVALPEEVARNHAKARLASDTAEAALELRAFYARLGFVDVGLHRWHGKTYRSVVMVKRLDVLLHRRPLNNKE